MSRLKLISMNHHLWISRLLPTPTKKVTNINLPSDIRALILTTHHLTLTVFLVSVSPTFAKLSSALAFLRGKSYVTRQEILDGLPYVTAHRLGRAKSSKGEIQGLPATLQFNNEQEWIREAIVNGYLLQETNIGFSQGGLPLMDIWDLYYRRCVDALKSAPALFWYEQQVLIPLHQALIQAGSDVGNKFTPVHWHIATMVVQNEKSATMQSLTKPYRTYAHGDDYQSNYNYYLTRVFSNPNPTSLRLTKPCLITTNFVVKSVPNLTCSRTTVKLC